MTQDDVREIALSLPGADERELRFALHETVKDKQKGFAQLAGKQIDGHSRVTTTCAGSLTTTLFRGRIAKAS